MIDYTIRKFVKHNIIKFVASVPENIWFTENYTKGIGNIFNKFLISQSYKYVHALYVI